jgi:hypothetical protein
MIAASKSDAEFYSNFTRQILESNQSSSIVIFRGVFCIWVIGTSRRARCSNRSRHKTPAFLRRERGAQLGRLLRAA